MNRYKIALARELPFMCAIPALLWQLLFLCVPLIIIIYFSIQPLEVGRIASLHAYTTFFSYVYVRIIIRSLVLAVGTALVCLLGAYPVAYVLALHVRGHRLKSFLLFLLTLPFWTNFLVQMYAWFFVLERQGLLNTLLLKMGIITQPLIIAHTMTAVFITMVYCYLPFMIMPLYSILEKIDIRLLEASSDLGATPWQTFMRVTVPLSLSGIKTGFLLVLVPAFGEFAIPALIGGDRYMMIGSLISYYFLVARNNSLGAAFTVISGMVLLMLTFIVHRSLRSSFEEKYGS